MKKILITGGPNVIMIDKVRTLSNVFGGTTGLALARYASEFAEVTLIYGPGMVRPTEGDRKKINIINIRTYDHMYETIKMELKYYRYDIMIHSSAVPDYGRPEILEQVSVPKNLLLDIQILCPGAKLYAPLVKTPDKIKSKNNELVIRTIPTIKIIDEIKVNGWDPKIFLVKFKLEVGKTKDELIEIAYKSLLNSKANLIVANIKRGTAKDNIASAYIIDEQYNVTEVYRRGDLPFKLFEIIKNNVK